MFLLFTIWVYYVLIDYSINGQVHIVLDIMGQIMYKWIVAKSEL